MPRRQIKGTVVANKMAKTVVVAVTRIKQHKKYLKRYRVTKRYQAHDEKNNCQIGETVLLQESRPLSKNKRWRVVKKLMVNETAFPTEGDKPE